MNFSSCVVRTGRYQSRIISLIYLVIVADALMEFQTLAHSRGDADQSCAAPPALSRVTMLARVDGRRGQCRCLRKNRENRRQLQAERAPAFGPVESGDSPAMLFHHSVADAEPEPGALAHFLRGVERVENFFGLFHARSSVGEFDDNVAALAQSANEQHASAGDSMASTALLIR